MKYYIPVIVFLFIYISFVPGQNTSGDSYVLVQGGTFQMGSASGGNNDKPIHTVTVSSFYINKYEVTVDNFRRFIIATGYETNTEKDSGTQILTDNKWIEKSDANWKNPYFPQTAKDPVTCVSWLDAIEYCNWLSREENLTPCYSGSGNDVSFNFDANGYRLPTEAEWEFAAKGGNSSRGYVYSGSSKIGDVSWYSGNSGSKTNLTGTKKPNELGLYDMSGNVWEWCWDWYGRYPFESYTNPKGPSSGWSRVCRGGSWSGGAGFCRSTYRGSVNPSNGGVILGLRLVRSQK